MNERYSDENRKGKTRKSAASAKPSSTRAATVRDPAPKSKKQKKAEARQREEKREQQLRAMNSIEGTRFEDTPEYKKLRRIWWICIAGAIVLIAISFVATQKGELEFLNVPCLIAGYLLVIGAFYIDLGKIRKLRKQREATVAQGKSKEARAAQKKARAEMRAQQKEAEEKFEAAKAEETAKKEEGGNSLLSRFRRKKPDPEPQPELESDSQKESENDTAKKE